MQPHQLDILKHLLKEQSNSKSPDRDHSLLIGNNKSKFFKYEQVVIEPMPRKSKRSKQELAELRSKQIMVNCKDLKLFSNLKVIYSKEQP